MAESATNGEATNGLESKVLDDSEMEEIQKKLAEQEAKEEERLKELDQTCKREIENRMESINTQIKQQFHSRMSEFSDRYESHAHESISGRQIDVLRVNKVIREVAKGLGKEWKLVFLILMKDLKSLEDAQADVAMIERQKPFMQAYKALNVWKETVGEEFYVMNLVNALNECEKAEIATIVMDIVDCTDSDMLMDYGKRGSVISMVAAADTTTSEERRASIDTRKGSATLDAEGPLGDRKFLKIAKQLGPSWQDLGKALQVDDEDLSEIRANEDGYQAAFKLLWTWRDSQDASEMEGALQLATALKGIGKGDLADIVIPPS